MEATIRKDEAKMRLAAAVAGLVLAPLAAGALADQASILQPDEAMKEERAGARHSAMEEIIVSATRRDESIQEVSISVTALDGEQIREFGIQNGLQVADYVPNFTVQSLFGQASPPYMNIRGVSYLDFDRAPLSPCRERPPSVSLAHDAAGSPDATVVLAVGPGDQGVALRAFLDALLC